MKIGRSRFVIVAPAHAPANTGGIVDVAPDFKVEKSELKHAVFIAPAVGVPESIAVTIGGGGFLVGDKITVSIQSNDRSAQKWMKAYHHTVQTGATSNNAIAAAINAKIAADGANDAPYTSTVLGAVITVVAKNDDSRSLELQTYTNSSAGTVVAVVTPPTISEGQPQDLIDNGVPAADVTLASYDTVRIDYEPQVPNAGVDSVGAIGKEIYWYGTPGTGNAFATLINTP
jgi:hypothetical protein